MMGGGSFLARGAQGAPAGAPQFPQNFAPSDTWLPQLGQCIIPSS
jgi:hypothetical protein